MANSRSKGRCRLRMAAALVLSVCMTAHGVLAQTGAVADGRGEPDAMAGHRLAARLARADVAGPLTSSARAMAAAEVAAAASLQPATPPPRRPSGRCLRRVAFATLIGGAAGAAAGVGVLWSTGGSDETAAVLRQFAALGLSAGAVGGLLACLQ